MKNPLIFDDGQSRWNGFLACCYVSVLFLLGTAFTSESILASCDVKFDLDVLWAKRGEIRQNDFLALTQLLVYRGYVFLGGVRLVFVVKLFLLNEKSLDFRRWAKSVKRFFSLLLRLGFVFVGGGLHF